MKTAIKIGSVVLGTLALAGVVTYFMRRRRKGAKIMINTEDTPKTSGSNDYLEPEEFVKKLKERKRIKETVVG